MVFLELQQEPGLYSQVTAGMALQTCVCSVTSGLLSNYEGHLTNLFEAWQGNRDASRGEAGPRVPFQLPHGYWDSYQFSRGVRHHHLLRH